ncbi:RNA polymerase sigma factor [Pirellulimonas nuda]|uniref:RNA polymerase sigma factor n=1 Tax=Pirellulimonas nuda TaxID=2528009 RepID=UPI0018D3ECB0|nr:sigma-70 family RNA polymerase sigma factor [Pirellulimonas nuda]
MPPAALFEILVRENAGSLMAFLRAAVDDRAAAEDLFQETMLVAWQKIGVYDRNMPFGAWLRGIARNLVLAHYRSAVRRVTFSNDQLEHLELRLSQIDRQPGDCFDERIAALTLCVERLGPLYREPVELHYRQRRSAEWIAERLATTKTAIQKRLQRARLHLADCLGRKGVLPQPGQAT